MHCGYWICVSKETSWLINTGKIHQQINHMYNVTFLNNGLELPGTKDRCMIDNDNHN